ncbi:Cell morphogenesis protein PAG1 [Coemansia sp. RSA 988]|nr:Cell morphogenesis protein PAG1 [Coemansia sp. RSA 988]
MTASGGEDVGDFRRKPRPNPFGNYSLLEAQRPGGIAATSAVATATASTAVPAIEPSRSSSIPLKASPFANYSFQEAQRSSADPPSPTASVRTNTKPTAMSALAPAAAHIHNKMHASPAPAMPMPSAASAGIDYTHSTLPDSDTASAGRPTPDAHQPAAPPPDAFGPAAASSNHHTSVSIEQYAIRALYEEFRDRAAAKIDTVVDLRLDREPSLEKHLEHGADPIFDRTLEKLGMFARRRPRVIIELLLVWRKTTIDAADEYPHEGGVAGSADAGIQGAPEYQASAALSRAHYIIRERKSLVSVYILCRALSAVVGQLDHPHLDGDLGDRLEELVFGQVKQVNPETLRRSQNRRVIQDLYARLIGRISEIRFASMSDRFIAELERIPMVGGGSISDERIVVLLHNMRFIKLRVFPIDALEESSAFLLSCAKFYSRTSGSLRLKHAWATLLTELLMPIAAVVDAEVNMPELVQAIDIVYAKAMKMAAKVRHVTVAFPLAAAALCVSRRDVFYQRWLSLLEYCIQRLKDKQFRRVSMDAILRMLWVYLFRYPESSNVVLRRIDSLSRIFFPATKLHAWPKTVPPSAFVYFLVCAACYNFDFTLRQLLQGMLQVDSGWPGTTRDIGDAGPILDTLNPARVGLAFQALVSVAAIATANRNSCAVGTTHGLAADMDGIIDEDGIDVAAGLGADGAGAFSASLRPQFPGVAQLSGLDVFTGDSQFGHHASQSSTDATENKTPKSVAINPDVLPDNINNALTTAISVVSRYCSVLYPVFGNYVLADERVWRQACAMPLFSSVVLTGSSFSLENTALQMPSHSARDPKTSHGSQATGNVSNVMTGGAGTGSGSGTSGAHAGASSAKATAGDDVNDRHYIGDMAAPGSTYASASIAGEAMGGAAAASAPGAAEIMRHMAARYPAERQAYVDLMTVHVRNVSRAQLFWEQIESKRLIESLVQNTLHVDQPLAAESRASLLDLLRPPSLAWIATPLASDSKEVATMFTNGAERLAGVTQAVVRATQFLRAIDERYCSILVGGIYTRDARSNVSLAQPGDPLSDTPMGWPFGLPHVGGSRRFMHATNLSTASGASNGPALTQQPPGEPSIRAYADLSADADRRTEDGMARFDAGDSDIDAGPTSAATAAAIAAALDAKARMERPPMESAAHGLDGGFLHLYLDLIHYLEISLHEHLADGSTPEDPGRLHPASTPSTPASTASKLRPDITSEFQGTGTDANIPGRALVGSRSIVKWAKLVCAIEANAVAILCSSNVRARHLAVDVLFQAGVLRRILASHEPQPLRGQPWIIRNTESVYEVLNMMVPSKGASAASIRSEVGMADSTAGVVPAEPLISETWGVPFGADSKVSSEHSKAQLLPLARLAASTHDADMELWSTYFPTFVRQASALMPDVMLIARTLVCQRLYQMQPLMNQYSEVSVRPSGVGVRGFFHLRALSVRSHDKTGLASLRTDLISAFGGLFLFAVASLPTSDSSLRSGISNVFGESASGPRSPKGTSFGHVVGSGTSSTYDSLFGGGGGTNSGAATGGGSSRSRLAKSIARKLAPLKSTSRSGKQEQGIGLASISQLVRVASVILRSDNSPLRQLISYALSSTPATHLYELMQELRPLADLLFDDNTLLTSHRNYLHVSGGAGSVAGSAGLMSSLGHNTSSPANSVLAALGSSPRITVQHVQSATHGSSKHRAGKAGSGSRIRDSSGLGVDTEPTSDSGSPENHQSSAAHGKSSAGGVESLAQGRRANSFDAAVVGSALNIRSGSAKKGSQHGTGSGSSGSHADVSAAGVAGMATSSANNVAAAAAAVAAAVNAGAGSSSTTAQTRRRRLQLSLAQIYKHVSRQLDTADQHGHALYLDEQIMMQLVSYIRETKTFLSESSVQWEWEHQPLRIHFCGLVEGLYFYISLATAMNAGPEPLVVGGKPARRQHNRVLGMFTHETRNGLYQLFERWCSLGRFAESSKEVQARLISLAADHIKDAVERDRLVATLDDERGMLELASLRAMAVLSRGGSSALASSDGPLAVGGDNASPEHVSESGGLREKTTFFAWVSGALDSRDTRVQRIGQHAVKWSIMSDVKDAVLLRVLIQLAYGISVANSIDNGVFLLPTQTTGGKGPDWRSLSGSTSGLGLVLGAHDSTARHRTHFEADAGIASEATLSSDRIMLGYLQALTSVLSLPLDAASTTVASNNVVKNDRASSDSDGYFDSNARNASIGRCLSLTYVGLLLPLVMLHLKSDRNRIRRQALLLLRALCVHMAADRCLDRLDELGPSIVSDIPAIAFDAAKKLIEAVAKSFAVHTGIVVLEVVRQVHVQCNVGRRLGTLQRVLKPWLTNIELRLARYTDDSELSFDLSPVALDRDSLLVLRCMLYMTMKTGLDSISDMQGLWIALVDHDIEVHAAGRSVNMWLVIRYLVGLLACSWSTLLLGFTRRIVVFLSRSSQGALLVQQLVDEATRPGATIPLDSSEGMAHSAANDTFPNEAWARDVALLIEHSSHSKRPLISTGALAIYYLSAISYERPSLLTTYRALAILPPAMFMLAHPEQWARDAARTVLVNLVASERAECIALASSASGGLSQPTMALNQRYVANEAAHVALGVLRGEECLGGFGNVDMAATRTAVRPSPGTTDSQELHDSDEVVTKDWAAFAPAWGSELYATRSARNIEDAAVATGIRQSVSVASDGPSEERGMLGFELGRSNGDGDSDMRESRMDIDAADPSLVADVADIPASMSQTASPVEQTCEPVPANDILAPTADQLSESSASAAATMARGSVDTEIGRQSSTISRRSQSTEYLAGDSWGRERATLQRFVVHLSRLFGRRFAGCAQGWASVAVQWAMSCPVRPLAGLALQVFGVLAAEAQFGGSVVITPTRQMVLRLVDRLSNVVGDPADDFSAFSETVLAGLRQTAGLAARMCAEDEGVNTDLLATSMVLMRTTQSASMYAMALSIFERVFRLVGREEAYCRDLAAARAGALCLEGYQPALLRGLEFAICRERCLRLLRETFKCDITATPSSVCAHPMLALAAHLPTLFEDTIQNAVEVQRLYAKGVQDAGNAEASAVISAVADSSPTPLATSEPGSTGKAGRGMRRHNYRRAKGPNTTTATFGSNLGLVFGGLRNTSLQADKSVRPSAVDLTAQSTDSPTEKLSPRLQLFRRRGQNHHSPQKAVESTSGASSSSASDSEIATPRADVSNSTFVTPGAGLQEISETSPTSSVCSASSAEHSGVYEKYFTFAEQCSQLLLSSAYRKQNTAAKDTSQLFQRLASMISPPVGPQSVQYVYGVSREAIQFFGYAVLECGPSVAIQTVVILLEFLQPSNHTRLALKYLRDEQAERAISGQAQMLATTGMSSGYASELRKIDICLQLLHSLLMASDTSGGSSAGGGDVGSSGVGGSSSGRSAGLRLDTAMAPRLQHLFDLLVVARPISDQASCVLSILLQRFDDVAATPSSSSAIHKRVSSSLLGSGGSSGGSSGVTHSIQWYESDSTTLLSVARSALANIVTLGFDAMEQPSSSDSDNSDNSGDSAIRNTENVDDKRGGIGSGINIPVRSVSPEMPVLVIPDSYEDEVRIGRMAIASANNKEGRDVNTFYEDLTKLSNNSDLGMATTDAVVSFKEEDHDDTDLMAQLDEFDRELDDALRDD